MSHINEKIDYTVDVYIVYKNKVLLRLHEKYNVWLGVGGHIELDENPNQAAIREVKEEVGLDITIFNSLDLEISKINKEKKNGKYLELIPPVFMNMHPIDDIHSHVSLIYFAEAKNDEVIPENIDDQWKWLSKKELEEMQNEIHPQVYLYANKALECLTN